MKKKMTKFERRIAKGDLIPLKKAAKAAEYSVTHLQRLCRGATGKPIKEHYLYKGDIYFTPEQVEALKRPVFVAATMAHGTDEAASA